MEAICGGGVSDMERERARDTGLVAFRSLFPSEGDLERGKEVSFCAHI